VFVYKRRMGRRGEGRRIVGGRGNRVADEPRGALLLSKQLKEGFKGPSHMPYRLKMGDPV
jgi:hypothetical protein